MPDNTSQHDTPVSLNAASIPDELKQSTRWVCWQLEDVTDGDKVRKNAKVPKNPRTGANAQHNQPETWVTFPEALAAHESRIELKPDKFSVAVHDARGIGYVFGPPFWGKDYDHCVVDGVIDPEVEEDLKRLDTYAEFSQSGTGVHAIGHGEAPKNGHRKDGVEIYGHNRYFVCTGNVVPGFEKEIRRFTPAETKAEFEKVKAGRPGAKNLKLDISSFKTSGSAKLADLMNRSDFPDASQAVQSLLTLLAIEHICDPVKIEEEFKKSKLYIDTHWSSEKWPRLRESELALAINNGRENLRKQLGQKRNHFPGLREIEVIEDCSTVERTVKRYFWEPVLQLGTNCHLPGPQASCKSTMIRDLIARITTGRDWPDGQKNVFGPKRFILLNVEDDLQDTILPEIDWMGGDTSKLIYIPGVRVTKDDSSSQAMIRLDDDIHILCDYIRRTKDLAGFCIDPLSNYFGKLKINAEEDVRQILTPLVMLSRELDIFSSTVGHTNRRETEDPMQRVMGAAGFTGVGRSAWMIQRDKEVDEAYRFVMSPLRTQGGSFKYHTEYDTKKKICRVVWDGKSNTKAEDHLKPVSKQEIHKVELAARTLKEYLRAGARPASECIRYLDDQGHEVQKLTPFRIRQKAGVDTSDQGKKSLWFLPTSAGLFEPSPERQKRLEEIKQNNTPEF
jgi:hypothetical protein